MGDIILLMSGVLIINLSIQALGAKDYHLAAFGLGMLVLLVVAKIVANYKLRRFRKRLWGDNVRLRRKGD